MYLSEYVFKNSHTALVNLFLRCLLIHSRHLAASWPWKHCWVTKRECEVRNSCMKSLCCEQTNLQTQLLPLTVQVLHLLLQQQDVVCDDVLGQVRLHGAQLAQALSPVLQGVLVLLHTITHRAATTKTVRDSPCSALLSHNYSLMSDSARPLSPPLCHSFLSLSPRLERIKGHGPDRGRGGRGGGRGGG